MAKDENPATLIFRCPRELEGHLPPPVPAASGVADWLKTMPQQAFSALSAAEDDTVKRCPPFVDAMTAGFLIPLLCDVTVKKGEFTWDFDLPACESVTFARSPIGVHDAGQVSGTPMAEADRFLIKFLNLWTIEAPQGYAVLYTHPHNRFDLPFTTLSGLVDSDRFHDVWINFPAHWRDPDFEGVLPRGTPIAQCIPVKRDAWAMQTGMFSEDGAKRTDELQRAIARERGVYRRQFRV